MLSVSQFLLIAILSLTTAIRPMPIHASSPYVLTTLVNFNGKNGSGPHSPLVHGAGGSLYGTTVVGGAMGRGSVFRIDSSGTLHTVYSFCAKKNCTDGAYPYGRLTQGPDGSFYGMTFQG